MATRKSRRPAPRPRKVAAQLDLAAAACPAESKPVRGVKLKTVSAFTMCFAVLCLLAFMAGRTDVSAARTVGPIDSKEKPMFLGLRTAKYEVTDVAKAKEWYTKVLGFPPYFDEPFYVGYNVGGYDLGLVPEPKAGTTRAAAGVAYWGVEDAHATYKQLIELGAAPVEEIQDVGGGMLVGEVRDPFGNVLGIIQNPYFKVGETK
jgi:catechol 2,3-dioxygenase-like lactoylglutathione lyase family enzyme